MKFLLDQNRSHLLGQLLRNSGHQATHVSEIGMSSATDDEVLDHARRTDHILISADTDFGALLALRHHNRPSVILFRSRTMRSTQAQFEFLVEALRTFESDLNGGCVLVVTDERVRVRRLPLLGD